MFNKALLLEKDSRIADLKSEIECLRIQVTALIDQLTVKHIGPGRVTPLTLEADAILSGKEEQISITAEEMREIEGIQSEAIRILSGTY